MLDEELKIKLTHEIIDPTEFDEIVIDAYNNGNADENLAAYHFFARSGVPAGTAAKRSFLQLSNQVPKFNSKKCTACMDCVNLCPDNALKAKIIHESDAEDYTDIYANDKEEKILFNAQFLAKKKNIKGGKFILAVDPDKCKGCENCVKTCSEQALRMTNKDEKCIGEIRSIYNFFNKLPETEHEYIDKSNPLEYMLSQSSILYTGGTCSCKGCGEAPAIRMMLSATGFRYGKENIGIVNETGCIYEYSLEYPYNPFLVPVFNSSKSSLYGNAIGLRTRWNKLGWQSKKLWVISRTNRLKDLSILLKSNLDINVLMLSKDSGTEKNNDKHNAFANAYFINTSIQDIKNFYKAVITANEFSGPAAINVDIVCQPERNIYENQMPFERNTI